MSRIIKNYVVVEKDSIVEAVAWAEKNCSSYLIHDRIHNSDEFYVVFSSEIDELLFALKWKKT